MKNYFKYIITYMIIFIASYLFASFYSLTLNMFKWNEEARGTMCVIDSILFLVLCVAILVNEILN